MLLKKMGQLFLLSSLLLPIGLQADWGDSNHIAELRRLEEERDRLSRQDFELRREAERLDRELQGARRNEGVAQREVDAAQREVQVAQREVAQLQQQVSRLEQEIVRERQRKEQDIRSNENTVAQARLTIQQAENNIQLLERELGQINSQRNPKRLAELNQQNTEDEKAKGPKVDRLNFLNERIPQMERDCTSTECLVVIISLRNEKTKLEGELQELDGRIIGRSKEIRMLEALEVQAGQKEKEVNAARANLARAEQELRSAEARLEEARNRPIASERDLPLKQLELRNAQSKLSAQESRLQRASLDRDRFRQETVRITDQLNRLAQDANRVRRDLNRIEQRIAELERIQPIQRVVIVGRAISASLQRDLEESRVTIVDVERFATDREAVIDSLNSILYVMADTLAQGLPEDAEASILEVLRRGGMVVIVGNPDLLGLDATSELRRQLGVETKFSVVAIQLSGRGVLNGLEVSIRTRARELSPVSSSLSVEKVMVTSRNEVIGTSTRSGRARLMALTLDNEILDLRILGDAERQLCANLRGSSEISSRLFCR